MNSDFLPKKIHDYPNEERLEFVVLINSPCTPSDILKIEKIPVRPDTLKTVKKKLEELCSKGKIKKRRIAKANMYWHSSIEEYKKDVLSKRFHKIIKA